MEQQNKKRKVDSEHRAFNKEWESKYMFCEFNGKPTCLICAENVAVTKEFNLRRHYSSKHENKYKQLTGELRSDKVAKLKQHLSGQQSLFKKGNAEADDAVTASYIISEKIAKHSKPFTEGGFVKECMIAAAEVLCPEQSKKFANISLSANTVASRITDLSCNIDSQLHERLKSIKCWSAALDESTDVKDTAQLAIFIRATFPDLTVLEELLDFVPLHDTTKGIDIFTAFVSAVDNMELDWDKLVSCTTDGAPVMVGENVGFLGLLKKKLRDENRPNRDNVLYYHCIIHQESLASKVINLDHVMMSVVVSCVNFIRSRGLNHRQFQQFLRDTDACNADVIYHTDVRWLSRGAVLKRFWELKEEIKEFMNNKKKQVSELENPNWLQDLAFLVDVTSALNILNAQLQGKDKLITDMYGYIQGFSAKLTLWKSQLLQGNLIHFNISREFREKNPGIVFDGTRYAEKMHQLKSEFENRFQDFTGKKSIFQLFTSPLNFEPANAPEELQMELIDMQESLDLQSKFKEVPLCEFYKYLPDGLPEIKFFAAKLLCMFGSTYLCETLFSIMLANKSKHRSLLTNDHLRAVLKVHCANKITPNISEIVKNKKCRVSSAKM